jgi:hypothetical protein
MQFAKPSPVFLVEGCHTSQCSTKNVDAIGP